MIRRIKKQPVHEIQHNLTRFVASLVNPAEINPKMPVGILDM
jgi:hypothetical protein